MSYTLTVEAVWSAGAAPVTDVQPLYADGDELAVTAHACTLVEANFVDFGAVVTRWQLTRRREARDVHVAGGQRRGYGLWVTPGA